ncbi:hypothetical protein BKA61DRAFT_522966 [Leptodontidium sp. MPI-SDFR-AT-0119]|nr:hypothetical protein BKA61DRAFT_522966 [Leptodontidium sp. MPI-SDFR-AT-0119]
MDHITSPSDNSWPKEIPYLFDPSRPYIYDNGDWHSFPQRMGSSYDELNEIEKEMQSETSEDQSDTAASLIQAWLYFGLIHFITSTPVDTKRYVRQNLEGNSVISTAYLPEQLEQWHQLVTNKSEEERESYSASLDQSIEAISGKPMNMLWKAGSILPLEVIFSIKILLRTLVTFKRNMLSNSTVPPESIHHDTDSLLYEQLARRGWCKRDIHRMSQDFSSISLYYIGATLSRKPTGDHSLCRAEYQCVALREAGSGYIPRHVSKDCRCGLYGPNPEQLVSIISEGSIPVLHYSEDTGVTIVPFQLKDPERPNFVAISHVWADGLGNPKANAMHQCQLRLIQDRVKTLRPSALRGPSPSPDMLFWIDTMCVPSEEGLTKSVAISTMETVYREATAVLVLDSGLELVNGSAPRAEIAVMIASSVWFTRLWTIQEGSFAKELYFQLQDTAVRAADLLDSPIVSITAPNRFRWSAEEAIVRDCLVRLEDLSLEKIRSEQGRSILRNIRWRFTTRAADEAVCLAILLGFDRGQIQELSMLPENPDDRMCKFLLMQKHLPSEIIFWGPDWGSGGQIEADGYRWSPRSYLGRTQALWQGMLRAPFREYYGGPVRLDETFLDTKGLHVKHPGLILGQMHTTQADNVMLLLVEYDNRGWQYCVVPTNSNPEDSSWKPYLLLKQPMMILAQGIVEKDSSIQGQTQVGVLVDAAPISGDIGQEIYCKYMTSVVVVGMRSNLQAADLEQARENHVHAKVSEVQEWCIR